ncbi:hypothetical protein GGR53DRAFT_480572 [Hypoxylon sp. FL1150]|nr:hypothetical protein GGR53DRAFT_480572 [Hypoxylon sp. FL1150]
MPRVIRALTSLSVIEWILISPAFQGVRWKSQLEESLNQHAGYLSLAKAILPWIAEYKSYGCYPPLVTSKAQALPSPVGILHDTRVFHIS